MIPLRVAMLVMSSIVAVCWSLAGDLSGWEESEVWTVDHLRTMASSKMATTALSRLAGGASSPDGAELEGVIDGMTSEELGTALLAEVSTDEHPANPLASLTRLVQFVTKANYSKGATCGAKGTAGAEGLEACTAQCGRTRLYHPVPSQAACYAICSMAVAPCGLRPFSWTRWFKERCGMVGATATAGAKGIYAFCIHLWGFPKPEYLSKLLEGDMPVYTLIATYVSLGLMLGFIKRRINAVNERQEQERQERERADRERYIAQWEMEMEQRKRGQREKWQKEAEEIEREARARGLT